MSEQFDLNYGNVETENDYKDQNVSRKYFRLLNLLSGSVESLKKIENFSVLSSKFKVSLSKRKSFLDLLVMGGFVVVHQW